MLEIKLPFTFDIHINVFDRSLKSNKNQIINSEITRTNVFPNEISWKSSEP